MTFTKEDLIAFNEKMLCRGVPNQEDGIGYNKADYSTCSTYFYGLSNAQYADLAKRLVKYCDTQLNVCKNKMKETLKEFAELAKNENRENGISICIKEDGVMISFKFNYNYIEAIKKQPIRKYDAQTKKWIVPKKNAIKALNDLRLIGADVDNAIEYIKGTAS